MYTHTHIYVHAYIYISSSSHNKNSINNFMCVCVCVCVSSSSHNKNSINNVLLSVQGGQGNVGTDPYLGLGFKNECRPTLEHPSFFEKTCFRKDLFSKILGTREDSSHSESYVPHLKCMYPPPHFPPKRLVLGFRLLVNIHNIDTFIVCQYKEGDP